MNRQSNEDAVPSQEIENNRIDLLARVMTWLALAAVFTLGWVAAIVMAVTGFIEFEAISLVARLTLGALAVLTILTYACLHHHMADYFAFRDKIGRKEQDNS
jgi:hypothetical protein